MTKGKFIVLEGVEGAGKSTQCLRLAETLNARGYDVTVTREPGGVPLGEKLRELILDPAYAPDALTELYLYCAARRVHLMEKVLPALDAGKIVVCDRFTYSTVAYQGYARGLDAEFVRAVNKKTIEPLDIDLALFIDIKPEEGFKRKGGADSADRMEREAKEFFDKVYRGFDDMCANGELERIDGNGSFDEVAARILAAVERIL